MDIDGGNPQNLSQNLAADRHPAWRPDGDWIAFTTNRDGDQEIYVYLLGGAQPLNLSQDPSEDLYPAWK
jgi:TolB protein